MSAPKPGYPYPSHETPSRIDLDQSDITITDGRGLAMDSDDKGANRGSIAPLIDQAYFDRTGHLAPTPRHVDRHLTRSSDRRNREPGGINEHGTNWAADVVHNTRDERPIDEIFSDNARGGRGGIF